MQVQKLRMLLREKGLGQVRCGTVDDFQGQEAHIVFISTVLSRAESLPPVLSRIAEAQNPKAASDPHLGFWRNPKRFNVATTRARALLVVVGHPVVLIEVSIFLMFQLVWLVVQQSGHCFIGSRALSKSCVHDVEGFRGKMCACLVCAYDKGGAMQNNYSPLARFISIFVCTQDAPLQCSYLDHTASCMRSKGVSFMMSFLW